MPAGRPSTYTAEMGERVCAEIAVGRSLKKVCEEEDWAPEQRTFYRWLQAHEELRHKYAQARSEQQEVRADEIEEIADAAQFAKSNDEIQAAKLRIETRKWLMGKLRPKKYGDKQVIEHKHDVADMTDEDLTKQIEMLQARLNGEASQS